MIIHYVSGSRADFGLMEKCLVALDKRPNIDVGVIATGQHVVRSYGETINDIEGSALNLVDKIPVQLSGESGLEMGHALADEMKGFLNLWAKDRPDLVLLLGDRGEMLAGALAAMHLGIHIAHIGGGELTGTLDESFRHAITKLSHFHFPCTSASAERIKRMGEAEDLVHVIGAPGLVGLKNRLKSNPIEVRKSLEIDLVAPIALCVFHPVVQEASLAAQQVQTIVESTCDAGFALVILRPNSDAGGKKIEEYFDGLEQGKMLRLFTHFERETYLDLLDISDLMIGNSSSGIIESASFATPCVNVGTRQNNRERNLNTFDCPEITRSSVDAAIESAKKWSRSDLNIYGDGLSDVLLVQKIEELNLSNNILMKRMSY